METALKVWIKLNLVFILLDLYAYITILFLMDRNNVSSVISIYKLIYKVKNNASLVTFTKSIIKFGFVFNKNKSNLNKRLNINIKV